MMTKSIASTEAQNNFGTVLDDVTHNQTRYIIERRGVPQAVMLSLQDFVKVLRDSKERSKVDAMIREIQPQYGLGQVVEPGTVGRSK